MNLVSLTSFKGGIILPVLVISSPLTATLSLTLVVTVTSIVELCDIIKWRQIYYIRLDQSNSLINQS